MILRRLADAFRKQDWFTVAVETLIVVLGVFLGLQVQEWSQGRSDRAREMQIVGDLLADLEIDRQQYADGLAFGLRRVGAANASLRGAGLQPIAFEWHTPSAASISYAFDLAAVPEPTASEQETLWTHVVLGFFPTPSTSTYDSMIGSGDIKLIRDRELVRQIQIYRNLTGGVLAQNDRLLAIRTNVVTIGASYGLAPHQSLPSAAYFGLLASEPELAASIRILATFAIFHRGEIVTADVQAARLEERLRAYLETAGKSFAADSRSNR